MELRQEVGGSVANLSKGESNDNSSHEVGECVIKVGVLRKTTSPLQHSHHSRPCPQEQQGHQHAHYGTPLALHQIHWNELQINQSMKLQNSLHNTTHNTTQDATLADALIFIHHSKSTTPQGTNLQSQVTFSIVI